MSTTEQAPDIWSTGLTRDPRSEYARLRDECPVARSDRHGGYWTIARYDDVYAVAHDHHAFSNESNGIPYRADPVCPLRPVELDPPEHVVYRTLVNPAFSPGRVADLEPEVRRLASGLLDGLVPAGAGDLAQGFALPLPAMVIGTIMGVPEDDLEEFKQITYRMVRLSVEGPRPGEDGDGSTDFVRACTAMIAERRARPGDDFVSMLLQASIEGRPLDDMEILGYLVTLVAAGQDTTAALIGHALVHLGTHPDDQEWLREDLSRIPGAAEELLRWESPVHVSSRLTREDVDVAGTTIPAGEMVALLWGAANTDPEEFPDAGEVRLDRFPNRHLAFGAGIHRCIGSHLARLEARVALEEALRRLPTFRVDPDEVVPYNLFGVVRGIWSLPATFPA